MIIWNEVGLVIGSDDVDTEHGKVILKMHSEIGRLRREVEWWQSVATGKLWTDAVNEFNDPEPF